MNTEKSAILCKIERLDGVAFGVSNHDRNLEFEGVTYQARGALRPSEIESEIGLSIPNMEVLGGVGDDYFTADDLKNGSLIGARVSQFEYDFEKGIAGKELFYGEISEIEFSDNQFVAVLMAPLDALNSVFGRSYIRDCQARFGDKECGVHLQNYRREFQVVIAEKRSLIISGDGDRFPFSHGYIEIQNNQHAVKKLAISKFEKHNEMYKISLHEDAPFKEGDFITVVAGCDKSLKCCRENFDNVFNFRGFPHMPGEEILSVTAEKHIGKS